MAKEDLEAAEECSVIIKLNAEAMQRRAFSEMEGVVNLCLDAIFLGEHKIRIYHTERAGKTQVEFKLEHNGETCDPMTAGSGGVLDIAAMALRIVALVMHQPACRSLIVLDEPFKFVDEDKRHLVRELMEKMAEMFGIQFVMVTHMKELETGTVHRLS